MLYRFDGKQPTVGKDTYVSELAEVIGDVRIGDNCYIGHGAILRGDYGTIEPKETNRIGKKVTIGHGAILHGKHIGDLAVIGMGAVVSIWSEVGAKTIIAEGSVVRMNQVVPAKKVAAGNPARVVRPVNAKDAELWGWGKQVYIDLAKKYLDEGMEAIG
jgi:carbonic anhydrase/acetyltransferase-like protein (isoleucine patch superfamily)